MVILARLLEPSDFGLVAYAIAVFGFVECFNDLGLPSVIAVEDKLSRSALDGLFWIINLLNVALACLFFLFAPIIADFFEYPELTAVLQVMCLIPVLAGFNAIPLALLRRRMAFSVISLARGIGLITGVGCGIVLALQGFGYWALALIRVVALAVEALFYWPCCHYRPALVKLESNLLTHLNLGGHILISRIANYVGSQTDRLLLGYIASHTQLGFYYCVHRIAVSPASQIKIIVNQVGLNALSGLRQKADAYKKYYRVLMQLHTLSVLPILCLVVIFPVEIITWILGSKWNEAAIFLPPLALAAYLSLLQNLLLLNLLPHKQSKLFMYLSIAGAATTTCGFLIGSNWGAIGVAWGFALSFLRIVPYYFIIKPYVPLSLPELMSLFTRLGLKLFTAAVVGYAAYWGIGDNQQLNLVIAMTGFVGFYVLLNYSSIRIVLTTFKKLKE